MLYIVVLVSLLSVSFAEAEEKPKVHLPDQVIKFVMEMSSDCLKETEVKQEIVDNFFKFKYENNEDTKKFMYCLCRKTNFADEEGHLNDAVITLFEGSDRKEEVQKTIDNCNNIKEENNLETMYQTILCVYNNSPVLITV